MNLKVNKKILSIIIALLILILDIVPSFAHNAVYFDFLIGPNFTYQVQTRDDVQGTTEAAHYEFASGYFLDAGTGKNRPLFRYDLNKKTEEETSNSKIKVQRRGPGYIFDESANEDRVKYYENYLKYKTSETSTTGLSLLGKRFTFPPMNATKKNSNKILHMDTTSEQIKEISFKSAKMMEGFNELLNAVGTQDEGVYISTDLDFIAVAEILADAIAALSDEDGNKAKQAVAFPIPINEKEYHWVKLEIDKEEGRKYNATVIRADGQVIKIIGAIRTVDSGFKSLKGKGSFILEKDGKKEIYEYSDKTSGFLAGFSSVGRKIHSAFSKSVAPVTQNFHFRSEMTVVNSIVAANTKYVVDGRDSISGYIDRDESILSREISKFLIGIFEGLESILRLQDYDELIFNQGVRNPSTFVISDNGEFTNSGDENTKPVTEETSSEDYEKNDPYLLGVYRASWHRITKSFYTIFLVFGLMVILFGLAKLLVNAQSIAINPYYRGQTYETILNYIIVALLMPSIWIIFYTLLQFNYYLVDIFGKSVNYQSIQSMAITSAGGAIATLILTGFYFVMLCYFNVVYVIRSINIAILMASSPLVISTLTLGPKYRNIFNIWLKELISNIFLQAFHSAILTFLVSVQVHSTGVEKVVLLISLVSLTNVFRSIFLSSQTVSNSEKEGFKGSMGSVAGIGLATMAAGRTLGAVSQLGGNYAGVKFDRFANKDKEKLSKLDPKNTEESKKLQKRINRFESAANASRKFGQTAKVATPALANAASGLTLAAATDGKSLIKGAEGVINGVGAITGALNNKLEQGMLSGETLTDINQYGDNIDSINANKDSLSIKYNEKALSKEQHKQMKGIANNSLLVEEEKQKRFAEVLSSNKGIALQMTQGNKKGEIGDVVSNISYDTSTGKLNLDNINTTGKNLTQVGRKVISADNGVIPDNANNIMTTSERLDWMSGASNSNAGKPPMKLSGEVAVTKDASNMQISTIQTDDGYTLIKNTNQSNSIDSEYNPISIIGNVDTIKKNQNGTFSYDIVGTKHSDLTEVKQNGNQVKFSYQLSPEHQNNILQKMNAATSDTEKIDARNEYIKETFGSEAVYNTKTGNVDIKTQVASSISNMELSDDKIIMTTIDGKPPIAHTPTLNSIEAVEGYIERYNNENNKNKIDTNQIFVSPNTFALNDTVANFDNIQVQRNQDGRNDVYIPLKEEISNDLNQFAQEYKNNYKGNEANYKENSEIAIANYAYSKFGVQQLEQNQNGQYCSYLGSSTYDNIIYDEDKNELRFFNNSQPNTNFNNSQSNTNFNNSQSNTNFNNSQPNINSNNPEK